MNQNYCEDINIHAVSEKTKLPTDVIRKIRRYWLDDIDDDVICRLIVEDTNGKHNITTSDIWYILQESGCMKNDSAINERSTMRRVQDAIYTKIIFAACENVRRLEKRLSDIEKIINRIDDLRDEHTFCDVAENVYRIKLDDLVSELINFVDENDEVSKCEKQN